MAPWHLGVVAALPVEVAAEVDGLRRALGDVTREVITPHVTLVPPLRVGGTELTAALSLLRAAAVNEPPCAVTLGPAATFEPVSPTVHLVVDDPGGALGRLRQRVFRPPLWRDTFPFVPHVTLTRSAPLHVVRAALVAFRAYRITVELASLTVLGEQRVGGTRRWQPLADVCLDGVRVIGRGGLALELATGTVIDPEARAVARGVDPGPWTVVVTARREGAVVGVAWAAEAADTGGSVVRADVRGQGIGRHLRTELRFRLAQLDEQRSRATPGAFTAQPATDRN